MSKYTITIKVEGSNNELSGKALLSYDDYVEAKEKTGKNLMDIAVDQIVDHLDGVEEGSIPKKESKREMTGADIFTKSERESLAKNSLEEMFKQAVEANKAEKAKEAKADKDLEEIAELLVQLLKRSK